jgi:hypothetical protein
MWGGAAGVYTISSITFTGAISATSDAGGLISLPYGPGSLAVTIASFPQGRSGEGYGSSLSAAGGTAPYSWSIAAGALPTGLAIVGAEITGTPTAAGDFPFTLRVDDAADHSATGDFTITILAPVSITTSSLPAGTVGTAYYATLAATGGSTPYTWSLYGGSLPSGLTISEAGVISGTPGHAGTSTFTARVTGATGRSADAELSITISGASVPGHGTAISGAVRLSGARVP